MKYLFAVVIAVLWGSAPAQAAESCRFENPLPGLTSTGNDWAEYKEGSFVQEVEIATNKGNISCSPKLGKGVSLLVPPGFKTEGDHRGTSYGDLSRIQVGRESYPIVEGYNLTVFPADKTEIIRLPRERKYSYQQEEPLTFQSRSLLEEVNSPKEDNKFTCEWKCKTGAGVAVSWVLWRLVEIYGKKKADTATGSVPIGTTD